MSIIIGGFQKNTLIDFPGVMASLVFTQGCNFRCPYCHNPSLILVKPIEINPAQTNSYVSPHSQIHHQTDAPIVPANIDPNEIFSFLKKRKGLIDGVAITGGEPTLQPSLESFCFRLKNMGLKVKVDTNGSRPHIIENLIKRELVDFIAMDIKSNKAGYSYLVGQHNINNFDFKLLLKTIKLIIKDAPAYEFRTTCVRPFITHEIMAEIGIIIKGAMSYVLQKCSLNNKILNPSFFQNHSKLLRSSKDSNNIYDVSNPFFSNSELEELRQIAKPYVEHCLIR